MRTISWILLTLVSLLLVAGGAASAGIAYYGAAEMDIITGSVSLGDLSVDSEVATALRGRRGTAAAFSLAFTVFLLFTVLGPYRKGEVWSWWAILCSVAVLAGTTALRISALGTSQGVSTAGILFAIVVVALLLDVKRLTKPASQS